MEQEDAGIVMEQAQVICQLIQKSASFVMVMENVKFATEEVNYNKNLWMTIRS